MKAWLSMARVKWWRCIVLESWRWYGQFDPITLPQIRQTGASGIVTALHEIPYGEVWSQEAISKRHTQIREAGFEWCVVESLPIHERIKRGEGDLSQLFDNYRKSMANLASQGIHTICYNFMPLIDWTRTHLSAPVKGGGNCLRFSAPHMAAFEVHMLKRDGAENDYTTDVLKQAEAWFLKSTSKDRDAILHAIMSGLPGAFERYDVDGLRTALKAYEGFDRDTLRVNFKRFLEEVIPTAEEHGMRLCVHPDDPPRDILGLPRIVSNADDLNWLVNAVDSQANGITLCAGSLGANPINDIPAIAKTFAERIHFAHLRNVAKEPDGSFEEADHLEGDTDMVALIKVLLNEEKRRKEQGRDDCVIPFRPDHGHNLLSDLDQEYVAGYPMVGRLRGLAELRGVIAGISHES